MEERTKSRSGRSFLTTGFEKLDDMSGGWESGEVVIVGARPSMGKTSFLISMAKLIIQRSDYAVGFISFETSVDHLMERILSFEARIPIPSLKKAELKEEEWNRILDASAAVKDDQLYIVENPNNAIEELSESIERLVKEHDVKVIMLDYLQLIEGLKGKRNREQ